MRKKGWGSGKVEKEKYGDETQEEERKGSGE